MSRPPASARGPYARCTSRHRLAGFSLVDVLVTTTILAVALMSQVSTTLNARRLARRQAARSEILHTVRRMAEHLRADEDWTGLYARLHDLQETAEAGGSSQARLDDGRKTWPVEKYFPGLSVPRSLEQSGVLIEVPRRQLPPTASATALALRENLDDPAFGLPDDLNGDGEIDGKSREDDYAMLPVVIRFRCRFLGEAPEETRLATWLRGDR